MYRAIKRAPEVPKAIGCNLTAETVLACPLCPTIAASGAVPFRQHDNVEVPTQRDRCEGDSPSRHWNWTTALRGSNCRLRYLFGWSLGLATFHVKCVVACQGLGTGEVIDKFI
jgi:hypothetical protein